MQKITDVEQLEVGKQYLNKKMGWEVVRCDETGIPSSTHLTLRDPYGLHLDIHEVIELGVVFGPIPTPEELQSLVRDAEKWRMYKATMNRPRRIGRVDDN